MQKKRTLLSLKLALLTALTFGHSPSAVAQDQSLIDTSETLGQTYGRPPNAEALMDGETDIAIDLDIFFKNLELINLGELEGQTFFGAIVPVRIRHALSEALQVELGVVAGHDFGEDEALSDVDPWARVSYSADNDVYLIAGTLVRTHWAHQALLDDTIRFQDLTEQGFQIRADRDSFKHDSWINWRIKEGAIRAEEFEVGTTSQIRLFDDVLRLDGQMVWSHAGGQISESRRVDNDVAAVIGGSVGGADVLGWDRVRTARIGVNGFYSLRDRKLQDATDGSGFEVYGFTDIDVRKNVWMRFGAGYFDSQDFNTQLGDPLFNFDNYGYGRANTVWRLTDSASLEAGATVQRAGGRTNWSANVGLTVSTAFILNGVRRR